MDVTGGPIPQQPGMRFRLGPSLGRLGPVALRSVIAAWWRRQIAIEASARSSFHLLPLGLMIGILPIQLWGWRPPIVALAATTLLAFIAAMVSRSGTLRHLSIVVACAFLGATSSVSELSRTPTVLLSGEATTRLEGRVLWRDKDDRGRLRYLVSVDDTTRPTLSRPPSRAEILVSAHHDPIPVGGTFRGLVRLRPPSGPVLAGGYDFAKGAFFDGVGAQGFGLGRPEEPKTVETGRLTVGERLTWLRLELSDRIRETIGGGAGAVASAIITGERSGIPDDIDGWLRATGLSHVLSISGLHMALVAGFTMLLMRLMLAGAPVLALHLPSKKIAASAALAVSAFYWALSGMDVATTRSFVMIAIMLGAVLCDRAAITLRNVSIAAFVILLWTPHALLTASFQMSFAATAAIVAAYGFHARRGGAGDGHRPRRGPVVAVTVSLLAIAATSLIAGLATAPYSAYHFQRIAPFGLLANMATLPLFSFWIMPLALLAMIAMPFGLDGPFLVLLGKGLDLVFLIARFLAERLPDHPIGLVSQPGLPILTVALLIACFLASGLRLAAVPLALIGFAIAGDRERAPDLLVFENGREIALVGEGDRLQPLGPRPNAFVRRQWERAYPAAVDNGGRLSEAFACETIQPEDAQSSADPKDRKAKALRYCTARTRAGLRIVWTDDYRRTGQACDEADIAIVARAIRLTECQSGASLVTLRSLRRTGSLAVYGDTGGSAPRLVNAITDPGEEWNRHRLAPWPERWKPSGTTGMPSPERDRR